MLSRLKKMIVIGKMPNFFVSKLLKEFILPKCGDFLRLKKYPYNFVQFAFGIKGRLKNNDTYQIDFFRIIKFKF